MFDIYNRNTWNEATDNEFQWKEEYTFFDSATDNNISEKTMVLQIQTIFSALEQAVSKNEFYNYNKNQLIKCILDNFTKGKSPKDIFPLLVIMIEKGFSQNTAEEIFLKYSDKLQKEETKIESKSVIDPSKKWSNIVLSGENEPGLEGTMWKHIYVKQYDEKIFGIMSTYELRFGGKLVRKVTAPHYSEEYPFESKLETTTYINSWSREGDIFKAIFNDGATLFEGKYYSQNQKIIGTSYFSDGKSTDETWEPYKEGDLENFIKMMQNAKQNEQKTSYQDVQNTSSIGLIPPSKIPLFLGFGSLVGGLIYFFSLISRSDPNDFSRIIISFVIMLCSVPAFSKYYSDRSKYFYRIVCAEMSQWVGRSSNDLIIKWGAPTKTYKFPGDKTMTVLEYKDSIRNYAGYRYKGMYLGQSKTTKYIKSFFVKDNVIVNYKYDIT
jgi:hypothetical protein